MEILLGNMKHLWSLIFSLSGLVLCIMALYYFRQARESKSWPSTPGIIISSGVRREAHVSDHQETRFKAEIRYSYTIGQDKYTSNRIRILPNMPAASSVLASKSIATYPMDSPVTVYYNPDRPTQAVLEPGVTVDLIAFMIIGIVLLAGSLIAADQLGLKELWTK
jgi:hypothetical protein